MVGIKIFDLLCSCDFDLDPMTFLYELDPYLSSYFGCVAQLAERRSLAGELTLSCARPAADG